MLSRVLLVILIILIVLCTVYAPVELSRVIVAYGLSGKLIFELGFIWVTYLAGISIVAYMINKVEVRL